MPSAATVVVGAGPAGLAAAPIVAAAVVVATGYTHEPAVPGWAQPKGAGLPVVHSSGYRDAAPQCGQAVLVVGAGNSGSDIALDLAGGGVREVWLSARSAPGVVPRQALGLPAQVAAVPLSRAPRPLAAAIAGLERRLFIGDLSALQGGRRLRPDAVVAATGYRPALVPLVGHLGVLGTDGLPLHHGGAAHPAVPGLHFTGFRNPITGALRELRFEAGAIARARSAVV